MLMVKETEDEEEVGKESMKYQEYSEFIYCSNAACWLTKFG